MDRYQSHWKTVGPLLFLFIGSFMIYLNTVWKTQFIVFVILCVFFTLISTNKWKVEKTFIGVMYFLVSVTFLNQSLLNISFSFFNLFLYRLVLIGATLLFLILIFKERKLPEYWEQVRVKGILLFLVFWMAYGMVSLLWAKSFSDGIKYLFLLGTGILFIFLCVFSFTKTRRLYWFYGIWMVMTILLLILGFINHFTHYQLASSTLYGASEGKLGYPTAVFYNQNDFAGFLSISAVFYFVATKNSKSFFLKWMTFLLGSLSIYTIYLTQSRASLVGVLVGLLVYGFIMLPTHFKKGTALTGAAILVMGGAALYGKLVHLIQGKLALATFSPPGATMSSNIVRLNLLRNTFHYFLETYGFGVGAGNLPYYYKNLPIYNTNSVVETHNWLAEIMGNFGLIIVLGYITMYIFLFYSLYMIYKKRPKHKGLLEAGMIGLATFLVSSISPSSISNLYFHWVFLGFVISMVSVFKGKYDLQQDS
jgi:teichuronic acid biosynthesis protein TuaE